MAVVDDERFKPNSFKSKEEAKERQQREVQKVISGEAKRHKKSLGEKVKDAFLGERVDDVGDYIISDVVVPAVKETISDAIINGIDMLLFGEARGRRRRSGSQRGESYVSYEKMSRPRSREVARVSRFDFSDLEFESIEEAQDVLDAVEDMLSMYDFVSVADFYQAAGITPASTDFNWGWGSIKSASISKLRDGGCIINMPRPRQIR